jgi:FkbM family methyltransferase
VAITHISRDLTPLFRKLEKILLMLRYGFQFPRQHGAWPKYEYLKPWFVELKPAVVVDVGVNVGQFLHLVYRLFPEATIVGVEPLLELHQKLSKIYQTEKRVQLHACACGNIDAETEFYIVNDTQNSSTHSPTEDFYLERPDNKIVESRNVPVRRLDTLLGELSGPMCVKIDVQGGELEVLEGLGETLAQVDVIIIEAPFEHAYEGAANFDDIYRYLTARDFEYRGAIGQLNSPTTGHVRQEDAIYIRC